MNRGFPDFLILLSVLVLTGCGTTEAAGSAGTASDGNEAVTDTTLTVLVDADYTLSHGWGHVFSCKVKDVLKGKLEDSVFGLSVYATIKLYGDLLLPFKEYHDLMLTFKLNPERKYGPPPGFKDFEGNYWELENVKPLYRLNHLPTLEDLFPEWSDFEGNASVYKYAEFPDLKYNKPAPGNWLKSLCPGGIHDTLTGYVQAWKENGKVRFIWVINPYPDCGRFYCFSGDTVDVATTLTSQGALFMTEVGIYKWCYIYSEGLLSKIAYHRKNITDSIWAVDSLEYWKNTDIPHYIYRYMKPKGPDIAGHDWDSRTVFDREGKRLKEEKH
ncbi:hypothetical protein JXM67_14810 [candidate division WOR-3 bacterium]|nr:hypothetical protein [candidate division WOR-3 bacterium]